MAKFKAIIHYEKVVEAEDEDDAREVVEGLWNEEVDNADYMDYIEVQEMEETGTEDKKQERQKIGDLEGVRNLIRIECSCGDIWIRYGNKALDKRERQRFIAKHAEHEVKLVTKWQKQK